MNIGYSFILTKKAPAIAIPKDKEKILKSVKDEENSYKKGDYESIKKIASRYKTAIENGKWTLERLKEVGMPEDEQQRNQWLFKGDHTFTTVHEALIYLVSLKNSVCVN